MKEPRTYNNKRSWEFYSNKSYFAPESDARSIIFASKNMEDPRKKFVAKDKRKSYIL